MRVLIPILLISKRLIVFGLLGITIIRCTPRDPAPAAPSADTYDGEVVVKWMQMSLDLVQKTNGFTPPVASRALGYAGLTMYEAVVHGLPASRSMEGQLYDLKSLPKPESTEYDWAIAANAAEAEILRHLFANTTDPRTPLNKARIDSLEAAIKAELGSKQKAEVVGRSEAYGKSVALAIWEWSKTDGGHEGFLRNFPESYRPPIFPGSWRPTENGKPALQPYWGNNRPFVPHNMLLPPPTPLPVSLNPSSTYYQQHLTLYRKNLALTQTEKEIAVWWADDPSETFTPPGHSIFIAKTAIQKSNAKLGKAAETFARTGIAVTDAFIACWRCKYIFSTERPYTFVRRAIDPNWIPFWPAPPFPAFTSGHSTQSAASAEVLTALYGESFGFTDNAHLGRPKDALRDVEFKPRSFNSFWEAAEEAGYSRFLGGIHIEADNLNGQKEGKRIGKNVNALRWK